MSDNKLEEMKSRAQESLGNMLSFLGLNASLSAEENNGRLIIKMTSEDAGRIIGRKGQTLESLQLLLNRIMFKGDEDCPRISLDIDGYARGKTVGKNRRDGEENNVPRERRREDRDGRRGDRRPRRGSGVPEEQLIAQALDAAKEVKKWGQPVTLPLMNAHDRRIIHITLQDDAELETCSQGDGAMKKVVINLKKSDSEI